MFKTMSADEYITKRVDQFSGWYDSKAVTAKSAYLKTRTFSVIGSLLVPVLTNLSLQPFELYKPYLITVISLTVSILVALDGIYHFADQWKNYRSSEQFLSREKFLFLTGEGSYKDLESDAAFILFVERVESQIAAENSATLNVIASAPQSSINEAKS